MKTAFIVLAAIAAAGCSTSKDTEDAIRAFIEGCSQPVQATLRLSNGYNDLTMTCSGLRSDLK